MLQQNYKTWISTTIQGKRFLLLTKKDDDEISVYDQQMNFYGSYFDERSFKQLLKKYGVEGLQCK